MEAILVLGFLLGMRHALEADHIAAVTTLAARCASSRQAVFQGVAWGLGHITTLFLACSLVLFLDTAIPAQAARWLEAAVGAMLVLLGTDVLRRMRRDRIHFHTHTHGDGTLHFHAHSHAGDPAPDTHYHEHGHPRRFPMRALYVGLVHGLAGSAALILLALGTVASPLAGLTYVALFGLGSMVGMAIVSLAISMPLRAVHRVSWLRNALLAVAGVANIAIGVALVYSNLLSVVA